MLNYIYSNEDIENLIKENQMVLVYFGSESCNVCNAVKPKIEEILKNYPEIESAQIDTEKSLKLSIDYSIFTIPVILIFIEGKEILREARYISIQDLDSKIARYYELLFQ
jgi:thiol-disulfide isomerase/thioredoxin